MTTKTDDVTVSINGGPEIPLEQASGALFNGEQYATPVPTLDGHRADTLKLTFAGGLEIDAMDGDLLDWFNNLRFGQEIELTVTGSVGGHTWRHKVANEETGEEKVTHTRTIRVHSIDQTEA